MKGWLLIILGASLMAASLSLSYLTHILMPPLLYMNTLIYPAGVLAVLWGLKFRFGKNLRHITIAFVIFAALALTAPYGAYLLEHYQMQAVAK